MNMRPAVDLQACVVRPDASLRDVMLTLDRGSLEIALVVDENQRLVGLLTDGDVRRALLGGATLETAIQPHMQRKYTSVTPAAGRAEVIDLMKARVIKQIPILDADGRLVGLHLLRDVIGQRERPNWAVIMAGGRGTRLAPLTDELPKPMLRVAGRPILERIVLHLVGHGVRRIYLAVSYLAEVIESHFGDGERFGTRIEYLREAKPLGTGGALGLLPERPEAPLLVMNGDLVTQADVGALLEFHGAGPQVATMGVRRYFHTVPFGCVELEGDRLVRMAEKPTLSQLVNAGMYVLSPSLLASVRPGEPTTVPAILEGALERREQVRVFEIEDDWIDIGQRDQFRKARGEP
jgi:dTDP-glucose pyrophosphorylase